MHDFGPTFTGNHSVNRVPINSCRQSAVQAPYTGYILSELKFFFVDLEHSNSLISQEIGKNIGMYDLWRVVADSPSVNTLNSTSQSPFC